LRAWYAANKERIRAKKKAAYDANPQRARRNAVQQMWRSKNVEKTRLFARKYDAANREKRRRSERNSTTGAEVSLHGI